MPVLSDTGDVERPLCLKLGPTSKPDRGADVGPSYSSGILDTVDQMPDLSIPDLVIGDRATADSGILDLSILDRVTRDLLIPDLLILDLETYTGISDTVA